MSSTRGGEIRIGGGSEIMICTVILYLRNEQLNLQSINKQYINKLKLEQQKEERKREQEQEQEEEIDWI